jgi:hypothetical protein
MLSMGMLSMGMLSMGMLSMGMLSMGSIHFTLRISQCELDGGSLEHLLTANEFWEM